MSDIRRVRRAQGLCVDCGVLVETGNARCETHQQKNTAAQKTWRVKKAEKERQHGIV